MPDVNSVFTLQLVFDFRSGDKMVIFNLLHLLKEDRKNRGENLPWTNICFNEVSSSAPLLVRLGGEFRYSLELVKIRFAEIQLHPN